MAEPTRRLPSLNALRAFEVAARHLNFRLAAEEMGVTQGAVAQQVRGLEAELGLQLFERHPRTLVLTEPGRGYVTSVRRAFELVSDATAALRPEPLYLTISVTPTFAAKWLLPRLPSFTARHPDIDLRILASDRLANFQTDAVDIAVRQGRPPFGPGLQAELLFEQVVVAVANPELVKRLGPADVGNNLGKYALLHDAHNHWPLFLEQAVKGVSPKPAKNLRFNQTSLAIDAALAGQGLALAARAFVEDDLNAGRLVQVLRTALPAGAGFYLVTPRRPRHPEAVATVRGWLEAATRNERH
jgi:LysR family glycine cleavage system transcriptional activator